MAQVLLLSVFYLYMVLGVKFFRQTDPAHFDSLAMALVTFCRMAM